MKKNLGRIWGLFILLSVFQLGCGGSSIISDKMASVTGEQEMYYAEPAEAMMEESGVLNTSGGSSSSIQIKESERKLIRTVNLTVETENYEVLMSNLEEEIGKMGGYIEYKDAYYGNLYAQYEGKQNRNASLTVRIPADRLEEFTGKVGEIGNITYESESVEDVTLQYVDLSSHKKMLQTQQDRLLELMEKAETTEDIITIESRLSEVRYEIESMESQLRTYDNLVDYSTVRIEIHEVERYTPQPEKTVKDRIWQGLSENTYRVITGVANFFVELIIALPIIVLLAIIILLIWGVLKGIRKGKKKLQEKKEKRLVEKQKKEKNSVNHTIKEENENGRE